MSSNKLANNSKQCRICDSVRNLINVRSLIKEHISEKSEIAWSGSEDTGVSQGTNVKDLVINESNKPSYEIIKRIRTAEKTYLKRNLKDYFRKPLLFFNVCRGCLSSDNAIRQYLLDDGNIHNFQTKVGVEMSSRWITTHEDLEYEREAQLNAQEDRNDQRKDSVYDSSRPFKCGHLGCLKYFKSRQALNTHKSTHSLFRPFVCWCSKGKSYKTKKALKTHLKTHEKFKQTLSTSFVIASKHDSNNNSDTREISEPMDLGF